MWAAVILACRFVWGLGRGRLLRCGRPPSPSLPLLPEGIRAVFLPFMASTPRLTGRLRKAASELDLAVAAAAAAKAKAA